jgi:lysophospholipase L1-like esterase
MNRTLNPKPLPAVLERSGGRPQSLRRRLSLTLLSAVLGVVAGCAFGPGGCSTPLAGQAERAVLDGERSAAPVKSETRGVQMNAVTNSRPAPLVILGASYAGGWDVSDLAGMPIVNRGISGQQSGEMLDRFETDVIAARPTAVILWGFINDIFRTSRDGVEGTLARTRSNFSEMVALSKRHGIEPIIATEVTIRQRETWLEPIRSLLGSIRGKESYQDWVNRHVRSTNDWLRELAEREGVLLLDLEPVLADAAGRRLEAFATSDGSHITPAGYRAITDYARPILERYYRQGAVAERRGSGQ